MKSSHPARCRARRPRVLLVAPHDSYRIAPYIDAARRLDVSLLIASEGKYSLVPEVAEGLILDLSDMPGSLERLSQLARRNPFAAVVATDDATVVLGSRIAEALGLPHNSPHSAVVSRRKDHARACLSQAGIPVPRHLRIDLHQPLDEQIPAVRYPCVVKPLALSASRGVIRADTPAELGGACERVRRILSHIDDEEERRYALVEEFISGREVAVEGLLDDGQLSVLAMFDKPDPLDGPYFEETYYITPSRLLPALQHRIACRVAEACRAYGLRRGPVHAELRIDERDAWILEVAARTIGGQCARLLRFGTGCSLEELILANALGRPLPTQSTSGAAGVLMIPTPRAGILRRVEGLLAARAVPHIEEVEISVREGYELIPLPEGGNYLGFAFARAATPAQAEAALREAHAHLNIITAPLVRLVAGSSPALAQNAGSRRL